MIQERLGLFFFFFEAFLELPDIGLLYSFMLFLWRTYCVLGSVLESGNTQTGHLPFLGDPQVPGVGSMFILP